MIKFSKFIELLKKDELVNYNQSYEAFCLIADGYAKTEEIKDFLLTINQKGISEILLYGAVKALDERSIKINSPKDTIDVCGTGGDGSNSLNISTTVAIILASMGIKVAKHGNKAVSSNSGSADIFTSLGININKTKEQLEKSLLEDNLAFIFAPLYHPALKNVAQARKELKVRTIFNFVGPLINPAQTNYQLIGCSDVNIAKYMAAIYQKIQRKNFMIVTGLDGMDEISISSDSVIYKINENDQIISEILNPEKYNIDKRPIKFIEGRSANHNAQKLLELLECNFKQDNKEMNAYLDIVTLNCAAALLITKKYTQMDEAIKASKEHILSKKPYHFLQNFIAKNR